MARDESRDVYVQRDCDGNFVGLATYLQSYEMFEEQSQDDAIVRYVPHDQLEAVEGERNAWRDDANYQLACLADRKRELEAAEKRIAELEQEVRRVHSLIALDRTGLAAGLDKVRRIVNGFAWLANDGEWGSYDYTNHSTGTLRAEIGACFDQVGEVIEATLKASGDRADSAAQNMGEAYPPRCKDGCGHWFGYEGTRARCMSHMGSCVPDNGSGWCCNHTRLKP